MNGTTTFVGTDDKVIKRVGHPIQLTESRVYLECAPEGKPILESYYIAKTVNMISISGALHITYVVAKLGEENRNTFL